MRSFSETVSAYGSVLGNNTSANAEIVSVTVGDAGLYKVDVYHKISAATTPTLLDNLEIRVGGTAKMRIQYVGAVSNSTALDLNSPLTVWLRAKEDEKISVNYRANFGATETQTHDVTLAVTKVAD